ncbi:TetR/AcrR family transcriptional regulator [Desulfosporosinus sp. OT]|uniref:TetR/AcrR family transcriptional regulator n=1 Tax=Desulfosporosinus sp. OT TaxID=913865 RepID=UPI000223A44C|nr:TetR/AcrR family transcriptional regulator [Desulfosporosinus sp. OT]EGW39196.1 bacterial regulatory s, tetR family protein [Desulfosporosinus sp. OT]
MQYKKDELRETILFESEKEFFEKGYRNASLRQIAKRAGMTIGNLYHYFDNKEALFDELVKHEYDAFIYMLNNHYDREVMANISESVDLAIWRKVLCSFLAQLKPIFTNRFLIMLDMSAGTNYEHTKAEFVKFLSAHFFDHFERSENPAMVFSPKFVELISIQIIDGIITILRKVTDENERLDMMADLFLFYILGIMGMTK